jgi:hypothetical protein
MHLSPFLRLVTPDLRLESVLDVGVALLRSRGLQSLLLDIDCTLKSYRAESVAPEVRDWLESLRTAGIGLCLVSNGRETRIRRFAEKLDVPFVCKACKPLPFRCRAVMRRLEFDRRRTALVGDQLFSDVMAARLAGLATILVRPIHPEEEPWFTRLKRPLERILLRWMDRKQLGVGS